MYASFCIGQRQGNASPASREELWRLLVRITLCKVVNTANRHYAARRNVRLERTMGEGPGQATTHFPLWMLDHVDRAQVDPDERLIMLEEFDRLLERLPEKLRQIVVWKVEGYTNLDISRKIGRTVRCVELKMQLIRELLGLESFNRDHASADEEPLIPPSAVQPAGGSSIGPV